MAGIKSGGRTKIIGGGDHGFTEASTATKRRTSAHGGAIRAPPAKRLMKGTAKKVHKSKPEDEIEEEDVRMHGSDDNEHVEEEEEPVRVPDKSKRTTRAASKRSDKETIDKGAGGTEKSTSGSKRTAKPTSKSSTKATSSASRKDTRKAPAKGKGKKGDEPREQKNKDELKKPKIPRQFDIRRILAQRDVGKERFYNVDWYPSWVKARTVRRPNIEDWEKNVERYTFQWKHDTVYKIGNPSNDTSSEMARQFIESVLMMYQTYMNRAPSEVAAELFEHDEWEFCRPKDRDAAIEAAADAEDDHPTMTAAEVMQHTFIEAWNEKTETPGSSHARRYGKIRVQFAGEIDEKATSHRFQPEEGMRTVDFVEPIFAHGLWDSEYMDVVNWDIHGTDESQASFHLDVLQPLVANLVTQCPYLLKKTWPLMFISLFYWDSEIKHLLADSDFGFELVGAWKDPDRWACRIRDTLIYTYMNECEWEMRCMDEVNQTFVEAQDLIEGYLAIARGARDRDDGDDEERPSAAHAEKGTASDRSGASGSGEESTHSRKGFRARTENASEKDEAEDSWETSHDEDS
ncbi:uncharacterized protein EKO05_0010921 [Ascochyta rabiei]|uniref:Uncharacterized protein n=1 Tax=Didymella rabiei TaxID=5454 RepID=A0A162ZGH7_DIDRA|nr:uncharacterized protein EKO05_0010921 [Ascochyta rabiei]KZM20587.1 hypothetical protein ST47_g8248 [Ascochyta rabiei]UPX20696.1 hypothetical protein EKO05_0010921 [Ascochyta rabiei]